MYKIPKLVKPALLGLGFSLLAACQHTSVATPNPQQNIIRNTVQMVRLPLEITREADGTDTLSYVTESSIDSFLNGVKATYADVIMLDGPGASSNRLAAVEGLIRRKGLTFGGTSALGTKPARGAIMLYVERYIVETPNCNYWPEETSDQERNNDSRFHGCSSRINLGLMVANPRDLISGHYSGASTSAAVGALSQPTKTTGTTSTSGNAANMLEALSGLANAAPSANASGNK